MTIDLRKFTDDELCELYDRLNNWEWDDRLGTPPTDDREPDSERSFIMESIRHRVGGKQLLRWHHIHNLGRTPEEFERWYEIRLDYAVFKSPDAEYRWGSRGYSQMASGLIVREEFDELKVVFKERADNKKRESDQGIDDQLKPRAPAVRPVPYFCYGGELFVLGLAIGLILRELLSFFF